MADDERKPMSKLTMTANGSMRTKDEIQDVMRAAFKMAEADLDYLRDEQIDGERFDKIVAKIANRLGVTAARLRLATGYGGES